ncbi:DUF937 domain-containing protein [Rhizobium deserti]|uniref:DUF937 domain-containing protein n=1 Tax=Rhizobium deserti TaxID=2547961 RepID=A0A4R5UHK4_9HYPH|nr:YidB family protein [Rhizobium deserti]TDK35450.1 DUF937 domain-containing protein [Rhizobium deserti]
MQRGPLKALLAVLAVAGYQNRDKIAEILKGVTQPGGQMGGQPAGQPGSQSGSQAGNQDGQFGTNARPSAGAGLDDVLNKLRSGGLGSILGGAVGSGGIGSILNGGLSDLLDQFKQAGHEKKADSWVKTGANEPINDTELHEALGPDVLRDVAAKTGLSEEEVLRRLSKDLPNAVDGLTPDGTVPPATAI